MLWVFDCGKELRISTRATDIFRRACILSAAAVDQSRCHPRMRMLVLDNRDVMPVVTEIVNVVEAARVHAECFVQYDAALLNVFDFVGKIRIQFGVTYTADDELVQVTVCPAECDLKDLMQFGKLDGL